MSQNKLSHPLPPDWPFRPPQQPLPKRSPPLGQTCPTRLPKSPRGVSRELKKPLLKNCSLGGVVVGGYTVEKRVYNEFFFFFTSPDGLQKTSVLLFLFIRVALTCSVITLLSTYCAAAFPVLLPLGASSPVPVTLSLKGFQVSDVEIRKKREMVGDTVRINAPAFLSFFPLSLFTLFI